MSSNMLRKTFAEISRPLLVSNYRALKSLTDPDEFFCPMIKCDGYGHGAIRVGKWLLEEGVQSLGVALVEEALSLRQAGLISLDILVFGMIPEEAILPVVENRLTPVLSSLEELEYFQRRIQPGKPLRAHLKFDTGMSRLGFSLAELPRLRELLGKPSGIQITGLCTHFVNGEDLSLAESQSAWQLEQLLTIEKDLGLGTLVKHALNSSALIERQFTVPSGRDRWKGIGARPGIALYGGLDFRSCSHRDAAQWVKSHLHSVMTLRAELVKVHDLPAGQTVSYGGTWKSPAHRRIGVVAFGYGDGYPRALSNRGQVLFGDDFLPVVGRVCMDYTMIDLSSLVGQKQPKVGDQLVFFGDPGDQLTTMDLARELDTISYEIMTGITARVPRVEIE